MSTNPKPVELAGTDPAVRTTLNAYIDYETAKGLRQTLTKRLGLFVLGIGILSLGLHFLPIAALLTTILIATGMVAIARTNERKARRRLADQLGPRS